MILYKKAILTGLYIPFVLFSLELLNGLNIFNNIPAFFLSIIFIFLLYFSVFAITGLASLSVIVVNVCLLIIYVLNFYRILISGLPFKPSDFFMAEKAGNVMEFTQISIELRLVFSILCLIGGTVVFLLLLKKTEKFDIDLRKRMLCLSSCLALFITIFGSGRYLMAFDNPLSKPVAERYFTNGVTLGFFMTASDIGRNVASISFAQENKGFVVITEELPFDDDVEYSEELMNDIIEYVRRNYVHNNPHISDIKPNVIVVMSEAFTDPTVWPNVTFSQEPTVNLQRLQKTAQAAGNLITPAFGGSTCDPEYEFLTGNSFKFLPDETPFIMHNKYINKYDERSLANIFKQNGYETVGIHAHSKNEIYARDIIYPLLGFDRFIASEDMPDAELKGVYNYISDEYFTSKIIEIIEENAQKDEPVFLYGISMQNHYSYFIGRYREEDMEIWTEHENYTEYQKGYSDAYAQGILDADRQLGRLIEYIEQSEIPTILFFFGDHQPLLGVGYSELFEVISFLESGDITKWSLEEIYKMYTTPYIMWANYDLPEFSWSNMSSFFVGANILDIAGLEKNLYFEFLSYAYNHFNGMMRSSTHTFFESKNNIVTPNPSLDVKPTIEVFKWLQYDTLFGNQYAYNDLIEILR